MGVLPSPHTGLFGGHPLFLGDGRGGSTAAETGVSADMSSYDRAFLPVAAADLYGLDVLGPQEGVNAGEKALQRVVLMSCSTPIRKAMLVLMPATCVPLQLLHLLDFCKYLVHYTLGVLIDSQDLGDGGLGVRGPSGLTQQTHSYPSMTLTRACVFGPGCTLPLVPGSSVTGLVIAISESRSGGAQEVADCARYTDWGGGAVVDCVVAARVGGNVVTVSPTVAVCQG